MNKKLLGVFVSVLLIGIVSASLIPYFGKVTGTVTVSGPVFYAHSGNRLEINNYTGGISYYTIYNSTQEIFLSDNLSSIMDFYRPSLKLFVLAKLIQGIEPKNLSLIFEYVDKDDNVIPICSSDVMVNKGGSTCGGDSGNYNMVNSGMKNSCNNGSGEYQTLEGTCEGNFTLSNVKSFNYRILGRGANGVKYKIKINGTTRVEVTAA